MLQTISISDLQKAPTKTFKNTRGIRYVLSNNKKLGMIITGEIMNYLETTGILDEISDMVLSKNSPEIKEAETEVLTAIENNDYSEFKTFDEL